MRGRFKLDRPIANALGAPLVALGYYLCAYAVTSVGCMPEFVDSDFLGIPVVQFLLAALLVAALTLIVFAALASVRHLRIARRLRRSVDAGTRLRRWSLLAIAFAALAFPVVAFFGVKFLTVSCV